jgi:RND family efflux transporter MFP subunit
MRFALHPVYLCTAAVLLSACSPEEGPKETPPQMVRAIEVASRAYSTSATLSGEIDARIASDLSFRVAGRISARNVDVGDHVKAGDVLASIDPQEQRADVDVATAGVQSAEAQYKQASLALDRQKALLAKQVTTRADYDAAEETLRTATGTLDAAKAQLATAQDALTFTTLRADADGVITARNAEVGQVAQAASSIFTLAHDGPRDAVFNVFEALFLKNAPDTAVKVALLSSPATEITAGIREISPSIDSTMGTIRVKVGLGDRSNSMPLGAAVSGVFSYKPRDVILLPWGAMASLGGKPAVWLIDPATSQVSLKAVSVSDYETGKFSVTDGLQPKDLVVSDGGKLLRAGQAVSVIGKDAL